MVEYRTSEVYPHRDKKQHIHEYELNGEGSYILEVQTKEGWWCLNATRALGTVGRLLNHSTRPNLKPFHPLLVRGKWRVGFIAQRANEPQEELSLFPKRYVGNNSIVNNNNNNNILMLLP